MNDIQLAQLLTEVQAGDNRHVDKVTLEVWRNAIGDLDYVDAVAALRQHRRFSTDYLQPAHIGNGVLTINAQRNSEPRDKPHQIAADVRSAKARKLIPRTWPEATALDPGTAFKLAEIRAAEDAERRRIEHEYGQVS